MIRQSEVNKLNIETTRRQSEIERLSLELSKKPTIVVATPATPAPATTPAVTAA